MPTKASNMADAIISGIRKAHQAYDEISGGRWVWEGSEYFVTTYVAMQLKGMGWDYYVTLESRIETITKAAGQRRGRPINLIRGAKRFDIVLWNGDVPIAPIEIKCQQLDLRKLEADLVRVSAALRQSNMELGALGYYSSRQTGSRKSAQKKIDDRISQVEEMASSFGDKFNVQCRHIIDGDADSVYAAGCVLIEQK